MIDLDHPDHFKLVAVDRKALALTSAFSYAEYRAANPESALVLDQRRAEVRLSPEDQLYLSEYSDWLHLLAVVEVGSPDTDILLPLLAKIVEAGTRLSLHILTTDDDLALADAILDDVDLLDDDADLDFPMLFFFDETWDLQESWGPRPQAADDYLDQWMANHPEYESLMDVDDDSMSDEQEAALAALTQQLFQEMRMWYAADADQSVVTEIRAVLAELGSDDGSDDESADDSDG